MVPRRRQNPHGFPFSMRVREPTGSYDTLSRGAGSFLLPLTFTFLPAACLPADGSSSKRFDERVATGHESVHVRPSGQIRRLYDPKRRGMVLVRGGEVIQEGPFGEPSARPASPEERIDLTPGNIEYAYDPCGRRMSAKDNGRVKIYIYDESTPCSNRVLYDYYTDGKGPTTRHIWGPDGRRLASVVNGKHIYYYHYDANGNVVALSDEKGKVRYLASSDPFGNVNTPGNRSSEGYVGAYGVQQDRTGLDYMGQRYYDPETGRFLSRDPLQTPGIVTGNHPYVYARNNPVTFIDPLGLWYVDLNGTLMVGGGSVITGGILFGTGGVYCYGGGGVGTPGASLTFSLQNPTPGLNVGVQGGYFGAAGQVGLDPTGAPFAELGIGTPGGSFTTYYLKNVYSCGDDKPDTPHCPSK